MQPSARLAGGLADAFTRFSHRLLRAWEAELRMGVDDAATLLTPALERAWVTGAPQLAPLAPLVATLLHSHMMRAFVPAYAEYALAADRRVVSSTTSVSTAQIPP